MTTATGRAQHVETFRGTPDGGFGVTLVNGRIERPTLPASSMDPANAAGLGTTLVELPARDRREAFRPRMVG